MIVLLNLVIPIVLITACFLMLRYKNKWFGVAGVVFCLVYNAFQPAYMPKGVVYRSEAPAFERKHLEVEDRLLSPKSEEQYDAEREDSIKKGLPFLDK